MTIKQYDNAVDDAKNVIDDLYSDVQEMVDAMSEISGLCNDADDDNWKDVISRIQSIADRHS